MPPMCDECGRGAVEANGLFIALIGCIIYYWCSDCRPADPGHRLQRAASLDRRVRLPRLRQEEDAQPRPARRGRDTQAGMGAMSLH